MDTTITITHDGRTVALAGRQRFWLAAHIQALPDGHPRRRHVCFMAVYARDVLTGDIARPLHRQRRRPLRPPNHQRGRT
ncbi:MAG: hypothetical protein QOD83_2715 [Solirubrobacteraceae bacterium]|jgi:hypothetical protein|nr:hypothetical protein [Solirubrobacteraceae bacterium]